MYRNIRGCLTNVHFQFNCYKDLARPIMKYAAMVCNPHQQVPANGLERTQRRAARSMTQDFITILAYVNGTSNLMGIP